MQMLVMAHLRQICAKEVSTIGTDTMISNELNQYHGDPETALDGLAAASRILLDMAELGELRDREAGREDFPASTTTAALWHLSGMVGDAWAVLTDAGARELPRVEL